MHHSTQHAVADQLVASGKDCIQPLSSNPHPTLDGSMPHSCIPVNADADANADDTLPLDGINIEEIGQLCLSPFELPEQGSITTLEQLRERFTRRLPNTIEQLQRLWLKLSYFNWHAPAFHLFYELTGRVAAQSDRLGHTQLNEQSEYLKTYIKRFLENSTVPDAFEKDLIQTMLVDLGRTVQCNPSVDVGPAQSSKAITHNKTGSENSLLTHSESQHGLIYVFDLDEQASRTLCAELRFMGHRVSYFKEPTDLVSEVQATQPSLVLMEVTSTQNHSTLGGLALVQQVKAISPTPCPVYIMSARGDMSLRLQAAHLGCEAFFTKPLDLNFLTQKINTLFQPQQPEKMSLLILGGTAAADASLATAFSKVGISAAFEINPLKFLESLSINDPDLLVLNTSQRNFDPTLVTQALCQDAALRTLPIVLLGAEASNEPFAGDKPATPKPVRSRSNDHVVVKLDSNDPQERIIDTIETVIHHARTVKHELGLLQQHDRVTGFLDRRRTLAALEASLATSSETHPRTLFLLRLDDPEILRKQAGLAWDESIHQISTLLRASFPPEAVIGRLDDITFAILWPTWERTTLIEYAKNVIGTLHAQTINTACHSIRVSASLGVTVITPDLRDVNTLISAAEELVEQAKHDGGNKVIEHPDNGSTARGAQRRQALGTIYDALEQQLFHLVFQPILKTTDSSEQMYEALLRLHDNNNKLITPQQFFPIVAQHHLYPELDRWVIEHAVEQMCHDAHAKMSASLFLKLSGESLSKKALLAWISNLKNSSGLRGHHRLVFEISENDISRHLHQAEAFLHGLPSLDCGFALEHFGSTDFSLNLLDHLHVDFVKLHGPLVQSLLTDQSARLKVKSLSDKARRNNVEVIASSIESTKTMALLWSWGVSHFQGHFIQQPHAIFDFDFKGIEM